MYSLRPFSSDHTVCKAQVLVTDHLGGKIIRLTLYISCTYQEHFYRGAVSSSAGAPGTQIQWAGP